MKKFTVSLMLSTMMSVNVFADDADDAIDLINASDINSEVLLQLLSGSRFSWDIGEVIEDDVHDNDEPVTVGVQVQDGTGFHNTLCIPCAVETFTNSVALFTDEECDDDMVCDTCNETFYKNTSAQEAQ